MENKYLWPDTVSVADDGLQIAGCSVAELSAEHGTPLYLMDEQTIRTIARELQAGFASYAGGATVCYASKALLNLALAQIVHDEGLEFDVVSLGEFMIAQHVGVPAARCHLHGNAKTLVELEQTVAAGIGRIIVDNTDELAVLIDICSRLKKQQKILLRIAPGVTAGGNEKIQTGKKTSKFGFNIDDGSAMRAIETALAAPQLELLGLHAHTGSQIRSFEPLQATLRSLFAVAGDAYTRFGWQMREISPGGGLAVPINGEQQAFPIAEYCAAIVETTEAEAVKYGIPLPHLCIEPGRSVVARSVVAVYTVTGHKLQDEHPDFLHVDGGVGDNLRPAMYGARYDAMNVFRPNQPHDTTYQLAGRYCESGDILIPRVNLTPSQQGDLIALPAAGAYTLSMASNYNGIGRSPVLLLRAGQARIIQRRETWQDIISRDSLI